MARISFSEVAALPDVSDVVAYEFLLGNIPGSSNTRHLTLKCTTVSIPGFSNESFVQKLHGHALNFRGDKMYPQIISTTFVEDSTMATQTDLRNWHERVVGTNSGNSAGYKSEYSVSAQLIIYDTTGAVNNRVTFESVFPNDVSDINLTGDASAAMLVTASFKYDRFTVDGIAAL